MVAVQYLPTIMRIVRCALEHACTPSLTFVYYARCLHLADAKFRALDNVHVAALVRDPV
jgi:hypothetical protein